MGIDTNLRLNTDTNLNIDREAIKNLDINKQAILRPNNPLPSKEPESGKSKEKQYIQLRGDGSSANWKKFLAALFSDPLKKQEKETQPANHLNLSGHVPQVNIQRSLGDNIRHCMLHKVKAELEYDGGKRVVEIYCWGQNTSGHDVIRIFQVSGYSESGNESGFKTLLVSKIRNFRVFYNERFLIRPGYKRHDEEMNKIYMQL